MSEWLIGLNLSTEELGPLELGAWLHEETGARLRALHVAVTPAALPRRLVEELEEALQHVLERQIAEAGHAGHIAVSEVRHARNIASELVERAAARDAGLLVGRCAPRSSAALVRLGRIARRVLRRAPGVVGIAPPDLERGDIGSGPVLLAIDPHDDSAATIDFARSLAEPTGRELMPVHAPDRVPTMTSLGPDLAQRYETAWQADARARLDAFMKRHELGDVRLLQSGGSMVDQLLDISRREEASLIVCGSRRLTTAERIFEGSVGSMLAATADVPVFVVPGADG